VIRSWSLIGEERDMKTTIKRAAGATKKGTKSEASKPKAKRAGDVIGLSDARVPKSARKSPARATTKRAARPKGIEVGAKPRSTGLRPARTVGGVRGLGR
jgi:hypothetical protein